MKNGLSLIIFVVLVVTQVNGQRKSELIEENQELKFQLDSIKRTISSAQQNERIAKLQAESLQAQVTELQDANATLLKNLNSFSTLSKQNSENINKTLATLERKEAQLNGMVNAMSAHDSTAVVVLTHAKQVLGENSRVTVLQGGTITILESLDALFDNGIGSQLTENGKNWVANVAKIINANPKVMVTVEGLSMTGELDVALQQATAVAASLLKDNSIAGDRLSTKGIDGGLKEGLQIRIHPNYSAFYAQARDEVKN
jgi:outer membrane protein OmpA-like peptidoglycan-associated protein